MTEQARTHILVLAHEPTMATATMRALEIGPLSIPLSLGAPLPIPTLPHENWPDHFRLVAAHGGASKFVVTHEHTLQLRSVDDEGRVEVELGEAPAALHMVGERVFVGHGNRVSLVDFGAAAPTLQELHQRPQMRFKAYDLFARDGAWLIAIDDIVTPVYADSFELLDDAVRHWSGFELPGAINGHYQHALLHARSPGAGTLFAIIPYGIMSGSGHDLVALPMREAAPAIATADLVVNRGGDVGIPVLEEHVPRGGGEPELLVGDRFTNWTGLAHVKDRLLLAAGERGLLLLADDFDSTSRPTQLDIGGSCLDVLVEGSRVFVLRGPLEPSQGSPPATSLVELSIDADKATPVASVALDGPYLRFVR